MIIAKQIAFFRSEKFRRKVMNSMKLVSTILLVFFMQLSVQAKSQSKITLSLKSVELTKAISMLESSSDYRFVYNNSLIPSSVKIDANFKEADLAEVMVTLLKGTGLSYKMMQNDLIVLFKPAQGNEKQDVIVTGKVTDASGNPLNGASVNVKGSSQGTSTNASGDYSLSVPDNAVLVVSYVGFETREVAVSGRTSVDVTLQPSVVTGEAVIVVGYGTQRKKDLTGSIGSIAGAELAKQPVQTPTQAAQGKIAGVQIISSGEPNSLPAVRIRGTGSTLSGANPLYVVDGVLTDDIRNINSADILSFDVLKDASATAIYGMRAANGVILITTKKGRPGKTVFAYDANVGVREATNLVDMAGENQYAGYLNEAAIYYGGQDSLISLSKLKGYNTDWYDAILRRSVQHNHNLSMSGGSDKFTYFLSAGYLNDEGILKDNKYNRFSIRSNNEYRISSKVKLITLAAFTRGDANGANFGSFSNAYRAAPYVASKVGNLYGNTSLAGNVANPLLDIEKNYTDFKSARLQGNFALEYKPIKELTLRSAIGVDLQYDKGTTYGYYYVSDLNTFLDAGGNQGNPNRTLGLTKNDANRWIWDNTATYTKTFNKHSITALAGITAEEFRFNSIVGTAQGVPSNKDQWYLEAGTNGTQTVVTAGDKYARNSYLGRINYGYNDRYLLTATMRADGTSNYGKESRWGYFPSVGLGWNISEEAFMQDQKIFSALKLRGSYGKVGNDYIGSSLFYSLAKQNIPYYFNGSVFQGITFPNINDADLKWEITKEFDLGIDFTILDKRLTGSIDYYNKRTDNALIYINLPAILPDEDQKYLTNATSITNNGVELGLTWSDKIGKDWTYSLNGNVAHNKNNIKNLNGGQPLIGDNVANYAITKTDNGRPIGSYYLREAIGIFQTEAEVAASAQIDAKPGDLKYRDMNGDNKIDDNDRAYFGSYQPKLTYGFNGNVGYKAFDLSFGTFGTVGSKIYNAKKAARGSIQQTDNIEASVARDRWTPNNTNTGVPRATLGQLPASTYFLESGDFFRLNNLTIGYTIGGLNKTGISNLRVYVTAQNLFTITPYSGFTPEIRTADGDKASLNQGVDVNTYPATRTFAFGVNLGF